jgi:glycosyltransferase involved in cell wall biosynthesis
MGKKTILYVIDNLERGGAETLLVGILPELHSKYLVILVTLSDVCAFKKEEIACWQMISLAHEGKFSFLSSIIKLRKIIKKYRPHLVHAHLVNSSIVARIACPPDIPVAISLHSMLSENVFQESWLYRNLEKFIFNKKHHVIAVSKLVLTDYENCIAKTEHSYVLPNYVSDRFRQVTRRNIPKIPKKGIRLISVGNIKKVKNFEFLLHTFMLLKGYDISLDIYGKGDNSYTTLLLNIISENKLPVRLMGSNNDIASVLPDYDAFVMSSLHEGFGIAAIEAMAMGLPLLLSDINVLKEVSFGNAVFFNLSHPEELAHLLIKWSDGKIDLTPYATSGIGIVEQHYTKTTYLEKLNDIYDQILIQ